MELVPFGVKRPGQADPHLEPLASPDKESLGLVEVGVVLGPVGPLAALHQVYGPHSEEEICGTGTVSSTQRSNRLKPGPPPTLQLTVAGLRPLRRPFVLLIVGRDQTVLAVVLGFGLAARAEHAQPPSTRRLRLAVLGLRFLPLRLVQNSQGDGGEASHR